MKIIDDPWIQRPERYGISEKRSFTMNHHLQPGIYCSCGINLWLNSRITDFDIITDKNTYPFLMYSCLPLKKCLKCVLRRESFITCTLKSLSLIMWKKSQPLIVIYNSIKGCRDFFVLFWILFCGRFFLSLFIIGLLSFFSLHF